MGKIGRRTAIFIGIVVDKERKDRRATGDEVQKLLRHAGDVRHGI